VQAMGLKLKESKSNCKSGALGAGGLRLLFWELWTVVVRDQTSRCPCGRGGISGEETRPTGVQCTHGLPGIGGVLQGVGTRRCGSGEAGM